MTTPIAETRLFQPGTTGWTVRDLDDPKIERLWFAGRYEIVEGVLTTMPPAYFTGGNAAFNLTFAIKTHLRANRLPGRFAMEVDIVVDEARVGVADAVLMLPKDERRQKAAAKSAKRVDSKRTRILVPPTLVIESVSPGHELHDRRTKRRWYSEFSVPNYWILDAFKQTLGCLVLSDGIYERDAFAGHEQSLRPSLFPSLELSLGELWKD